MTGPKRKNAQDLFQETDSFVIDKKVAFSEAFPQIEYVVVAVEESGRGVNPEDKTRSYRSKDLSVGEYIGSCSNPLCYGGGIRVGSYLRQMVSENKTEHEYTDLCKGKNASPKGRRSYGPCNNHFRVKITIKYREQDVPNSKTEETRTQDGGN